MTDALRRELEGAGSLATAIRIGLGRQPAWMEVDVVVQDACQKLEVPNRAGPHKIEVKLPAPGPAP